MWRQFENDTFRPPFCGLKETGGLWWINSYPPYVAIIYPYFPVDTNGLSVDILGYSASQFLFLLLPLLLLLLLLLLGFCCLQCPASTEVTGLSTPWCYPWMNSWLTLSSSAATRYAIPRGMVFGQRIVSADMVEPRCCWCVRFVFEAQCIMLWNSRPGWDAIDAEFDVG